MEDNAIIESSSIGSKILEITQKRLNDAINQNIILEANVILLQGKVNKFDEEYSDYDTLNTAYRESQDVYNELLTQYDGQLELFEKTKNSLDKLFEENNMIKTDYEKLQKELEEIKIANGK